jgi:hypothetical protein
VYYRKVREGRRVRSIYCGSGERGEAAAREDAERRSAGVCPAPPPAAPTQITRAEIIRRAVKAGRDYERPWRRKYADEYLTRSALSSALRLAGIEEAEVALRGLDLSGSYSSYPRPAAPPVSKFRPWE